jgi:hypothetical protein
VPNQPKTPVKSFRIPDELYQAALMKARQEERSLTEVVRAALLAYITGAEA